MEKVGFRTTWGLLLISLMLSAPASSQETVLTPFSEMQSLNDGWEPLEFPKIDQLSRYELTTEDGQQVVRATTEGGASGLIARVRLEPADSLILQWRWKVSNVFEKGNAREKSGDDYPARIYVAFEFQPDKAGFFERAKRKTVEVLFGDKVGEWVTVERDIMADYREAFGEEPPPVVGIAIMSDSDNTGEKATAWYGDIRLNPDS